MGIISREARQVAWGVGDTASSAFSKIGNVFEDAVGGLRGFAVGLIDYDVVGINEAAIPNMKAAIRAYIDNLNAHMDEVRTTADTSNAFKGTYAEEVSDFVRAVCECIEVVISQLLVFNDKLTEVYEAYVEKDKDVASSISNQADELRSSSGEMYQEKYQ